MDITQKMSNVDFQNMSVGLTRCWIQMEGQRQQSFSASTHFARRAPKIVSRERTRALRLISLEPSYLITWWTRAAPMMPPALMCWFGVRDLYRDMFLVCTNSCKLAETVSVRVFEWVCLWLLLPHVDQQNQWRIPIHCHLISVKNWCWRYNQRCNPSNTKLRPQLVTMTAVGRELNAAAIDVIQLKYLNSNHHYANKTY